MPRFIRKTTKEVEAIRFNEEIWKAYHRKAYHTLDEEKEYIDDIYGSIFKKSDRYFVSGINGQIPVEEGEWVIQTNPLEFDVMNERRFFATFQRIT